MFRHIFKNEKTPLDDLITEVTTQMNNIGPDSDEYLALLDKLERLNKMKAKEAPNRVDRNTIALIAGNLAGILLIVAYEQKHVMTSKGFTQIIRPKTPQTD